MSWTNTTEFNNFNFCVFARDHTDRKYFLEGAMKMLTYQGEAIAPSSALLAPLLTAAKYLSSPFIHLVSLVCLQQSSIQNTFLQLKKKLQRQYRSHAAKSLLLKLFPLNIYSEQNWTSLKYCITSFTYGTFLRSMILINLLVCLMLYTSLPNIFNELRFYSNPIVSISQKCLWYWPIYSCQSELVPLWQV